MARRGERSVLRIGVVRAGRILDERLVRDRRLPELAAGPAQLPLRWHSGRWWLRPEGQTGRVALGEGVVDLRRIARSRVPLASGARGRLRYGDVTVLFQVLTAQPALQLPQALRRRPWGGVDRGFALTLSASLAVQVLAVGFLSTVEHPLAAKPIPAEYDWILTRAAPSPKPAPEPEAVEKSAGEGEAVAAATPAPKAEPTPATTPRKTNRRGSAPKTVLHLLGSHGHGGTLRDTLVEPTAAAQIGRAFDGVDFVVARGGETPRDRIHVRGPAALVEIPTTLAQGSGGVKTGAKRREVKVRGLVRVKPAGPQIGGEMNPERAARSFRRVGKRLRGCYERALKRDRGLAGKLKVQVTVQPSGRASARVVGGSLRSPAVRTCVLNALERTRFPKPTGGAVTLSLPVVFAPTK